MNCLQHLCDHMNTYKCVTYLFILLTGRGKFYSASSGVTYIGEWQDGLKHGIGNIFFSNGDSFSGRWSRGVVEGNVKFEFHDGSPWLSPEY